MLNVNAAPAATPEELLCARCHDAAEPLVEYECRRCGAPVCNTCEGHFGAFCAEHRCEDTERELACSHERTRSRWGGTCCLDCNELLVEPDEDEARHGRGF